MGDCTSSDLAGGLQGGIARAMRCQNRRVALQSWLVFLPLLGLPGHGVGAEPVLKALTKTALLGIESPPNEKAYDVHHHFLRSNERRHDLFFSALHGVGGGYLGVGADQNYTLAAVARAEVVWLVDIDGDVVDWHKIYAALIPQAQSPAALLALLSGRHDAQAKAALEARWDSTEANRLWPIYLRYRGYLLQHLSGERTVTRRGMPVTWLANPELYAYIHKLMTERRVVARVGDLHGERTLLGIAEAARAGQVALRAIYLSNVEQWFRYSPQFRRNLESLPRDQGTLILRTLARGELRFPEEDRWHFSVQTLDDFIEKMEAQTKPVTSVSGLMPAMQQAKQPGVYGLSWIGNVRQAPRLLPPWQILPPLRP